MAWQVEHQCWHTDALLGEENINQILVFSSPFVHILTWINPMTLLIFRPPSAWHELEAMGQNKWKICIAKHSATFFARDLLWLIFRSRRVNEFRIGSERGNDESDYIVSSFGTSAAPLSSQISWPLFDEGTDAFLTSKAAGGKTNSLPLLFIVRNTLAFRTDISKSAQCAQEVDGTNGWNLMVKCLWSDKSWWRTPFQSGL